jgi:hypothetical protein
MRGTSSGAYMTSITLDISSTDSIAHGIGMLQRLLGNANFAGAPAPAGATSSGTAKDGAAHGKTAGASSPAAASAPVQPQASTAAAEAGNGAAAAGQAVGATSASSPTPADSPAPTFDETKKAFLALSATKGRAACEGVLKPFGIAKLSDAKPEQYAALLYAIKDASK